MVRIPDKIQNFNVYTDGEQLIGVSGEVTLPEITVDEDAELPAWRRG